MVKRERNTGRSLRVAMNGHVAGRWHVTSGEHRFDYTEISFPTIRRCEHVFAGPSVRVPGGALSRRNLTLAMGWHGKNRHYRHAEIQPRHIETVARRCDFGSAWAELVKALPETVTRAVEEVSAELPTGFPERIAGPILDGALGAVRMLKHD